MQSSLHAEQPSKLGWALYSTKQRSVAALFGPLAGMWHGLIGQREGKGDPRLLTTIQRLHEEALRADYRNAEQDLYPKSLILPLPGWHDVRFLPRAFVDLPLMYLRKKRNAYEIDDSAASAELPEYYRRAFHWQTNGWMSAHSAKIYELQVEFLFFGTMDVMRRGGLAALVRALGGDRRRMRVRILDVACGTGRFLEQARATLPEATLEGVDLSPFYLRRAEQRLGRGAKLRVANAESLGGPDGVYDAVTCSFLMHEMPKDARRRVVKELFRVLEPGGVLMLEDSMQRMDPSGSELSVFLDWFPVAYHEPYFKGYVDDDLSVVLEEAGFRIEATEHPLFAKVLVAKKPLD